MVTTSKIFDPADVKRFNHFRHRYRQPTHPYVDYSTPPLSSQSLMPFLIVDISYTLMKYKHYTTLQPFYNIFPLPEIIEMLLSVSADEVTPGYQDFLMEQTLERVGLDIDQLDADGLCLFYEDLVRDVEEEIGRKAPAYSENTDYVFFQWIDPMSICLCNNYEMRLLKGFPQGPVPNRGYRSNRHDLFR